jgi:HPt (histidine-containing phosphotransfer) domain-containing protein
MGKPGKYVDLSYLENMSGGSKSLIEEMVQIFIDQVPEFAMEMKELIEKKDYHSLGLLAHKAKSSVAIMGMNKLADNLKELELMAKEGKEVDQYPSYIENFEQSCQEAIQELKEMIKNL